MNVKLSWEKLREQLEGWSLLIIVESNIKTLSSAWLNFVPCFIRVSIHRLLVSCFVFCFFYEVFILFCSLSLTKKQKQISNVLKRKGSQHAAGPLPFSYTCLESFLSPVTMIPGSSLVMQLLTEALSPSARRPLLRDLWLLCHVIQGGSAEGFYVRHAAFITFEFWWLISSRLALQTGVGAGHRKIHFTNFLSLKVTVLLRCWEVRTKHNYIRGAFLYICFLMITIWICTTRLGAHFAVHFSLLWVVFKVRQKK